MARVSVSPAVRTLVDMGAHWPVRLAEMVSSRSRKDFIIKKKCGEQDIPFYLWSPHTYVWASPSTYPNTTNLQILNYIYIRTCVHIHMYMCVYLYIKLVEILALWFFAWLIYHFRQESYFFKWDSHTLLSYVLIFNPNYQLYGVKEN